MATLDRQRKDRLPSTAPGNIRSKVSIPHPIKWMLQVSELLLKTTLQSLTECTIFCNFNRLNFFFAGGVDVPFAAMAAMTAPTTFDISSTALRKKSCEACFELFRK